LRLKKE